MLKPEVEDAALQQVLDAVARLVAAEVGKAESRLRVELCKSQSDENRFVWAELVALRDDLCRVLRGGAEHGDMIMHLSDKHRRIAAAETKP
jgi:hypothetical protein